MADNLRGNTQWLPEHEAALKLHMSVAGKPFSLIAELINIEFGTNYTRNSTVGKASRMGLKSLNPSGKNFTPDRPRKPRKSRTGQPRKSSQHHSVTKIVAGGNGSIRLIRSVQTEEYKLRCIEIKCETEHVDVTGCWYPEGDGPFLFCNGPRQVGSSYCTPHFYLTRQQAKPISDKFWRGRNAA